MRTRDVREVRHRLPLPEMQGRVYAALKGDGRMIHPSCERCQGQAVDDDGYCSECGWMSASQVREALMVSTLNNDGAPALTHQGAGRRSKEEV